MRPDTCEFCCLRPALCYGIDNALGTAGCVSLDHRKCAEWEWTCICDPELLSQRLEEVRNFDCELEVPLSAIRHQLPLYIPTMYHRFPGERPIQAQWVALPLHYLFCQAAAGDLVPVARNAPDLRQAIGVGPDTKIAITGPAPDAFLEEFWRLHQQGNLISLMSTLEISLFTAPNFSFFLDAPPMHNRYNRGRMLRVVERASAVGIRTVLHLNALHEKEWNDFTRLLQTHEEIAAVCVEFQTGLRDPKLAHETLQHLVRLQKTIRRPLHPILIGGAKHVTFLGENFATGTIIDAQVFMRTFHRRVCRITENGRIDWRFNRSAINEHLQGRFELNLQVYSHRMNERFKGVRPIRQQEFPFRTPATKRSRPHPNQKLAASLSLFSGIPEPAVRVPDSAKRRRSGRTRMRHSELQNKTQEAPTPPTAESAANRANLYHKNNSRIRLPSAFERERTVDAVGDH